MNILVFSDSHGKGENIGEALSRQLRRPDAIVFLGDGLRDIAYFEAVDIPVYSVRGNCDAWGMSNADVPDEQLLILGNKRILITHGHDFHVKSLISPLIVRANELGADIVLFGHTHQAFEKLIDVENEYGIRLSKPMLLFNPGSIGSYPYSFGCLELTEKGQALASHGTLR